MKKLDRYKFGRYTSIIIILFSANIVTSLSLNTRGVSLPTFGTILTSTLPLHTDSKYVKDLENNTVVLRGVWKGTYTDSSTGWWGGSFYNWDEQAVRAGFNDLKRNWKVNSVLLLFWIDWWMRDAPDSTAGPDTTDIGARTAIIETIKIAQEYGLYVQIRPFGVSSVEGRVSTPYPPYHDGSILPDVDSYAQFWGDAASELKDYPNVIFGLYDEPGGDKTIWFEAANKSIAAIRDAGANQLIVNHYGFCGDCNWMEEWILQGFPTHNIVFSNHIYRYHGSFEWRTDTPVDIEYIRDYLTRKNTAAPSRPNGGSYKYIIDTYDVPIWVSAVGAHNGVQNDEEYLFFWNTLSVLNEWEIGYAVWHWGRHWIWDIQEDDLMMPSHLDPPNRVGKAFIDSNLGIQAPPIHTLTIDSNITATITVDNIKRTLPYNTTLFEDIHKIIVPQSVTIYNHNPLMGYTGSSDIGVGYNPYLYTTGPYSLTSTQNVSTIYLYTVAEGNARLAIYSEQNGNPDNLLVQSETQPCNAGEWNSFTLLETTLTPGMYFIGIKIHSNNMLSSGPLNRTYSSPFRTHDPNQPFPNPFGTVEGRMIRETSAYIPYENTTMLESLHTL